MYWNERSAHNPDGCSGLIETWDVLKYHYMKIKMTTKDRLIETWDVLKFLYIYTWQNSAKRLIETWDVLKFNSCSNPFADKYD